MITTKPTEAKRREITQLLREYRAFHTPFGGAMPTDESHLRSADYHSAGFVEAGAYYDAKDRRWLAESYEHLDMALILLGREDFEARISLSSPYLGSEADPSVVAEWRKTQHLVSSRLFLERHDRAVELLAGYLANVDLYCVWPKRRSVREEKELERRNAQIVAEVEDLVAGGMKPSKAKKTVADWNGGISVRRVEQIMELHRS